MKSAPRPAKPLLKQFRSTFTKAKTWPKRGLSRHPRRPPPGLSPCLQPPAMPCHWYAHRSTMPLKWDSKLPNRPIRMSGRPRSPSLPHAPARLPDPTNSPVSSAYRRDHKILGTFARCSRAFSCPKPPHTRQNERPASRLRAAQGLDAAFDGCKSRDHCGLLTFNAELNMASSPSLTH